MQRRSRAASFQAFMAPLGGLLLTLAWYLLLLRFLRDTHLGDLFLERGWVQYATTLLFAWAAVALVLRTPSITGQRRALRINLLPDNLDRITPELADQCVQHIRHTSESRELSGTPLVQRLSVALEHFRLRRSTTVVVQQLDTLAETDATALESSYTMVKVFIWAIPILGFIGTVMGIGDAVGGFDETVKGAEQLDAIKDGIAAVTGGLATAFDTTFLALVMSLLIMLPASGLQKYEEELLAETEGYCEKRFVRRLDDGPGKDTVERKIVEAAIAKEMARHHAKLEIWFKKLSSVGERITSSVEDGMHKVMRDVESQQRANVEEINRWLNEKERESLARVHQSQEEVIGQATASWEEIIKGTSSIHERAAKSVEGHFATLGDLAKETQNHHTESAKRQAEILGTMSDAASLLKRTFETLAVEAQKGRGEMVGELRRQLEEMGAATDQIGRVLERLVQEKESTGRRFSEDTASMLEALQGLQSRLSALETGWARANDSQMSRLENLEQSTAFVHEQQREAHKIGVEAMKKAAEAVAEMLQHFASQAEGLQEKMVAEVSEILEEMLTRVQSLKTEIAGIVRGTEGSFEKTATALHNKAEQLEGLIESWSAENRSQPRHGGDTQKSVLRRAGLLRRLLGRP